jgi:hypothetical protein
MWDIRTNKKSSTTFKAVRMSKQIVSTVFDKSNGGIVVQSIGHALDITGPITDSLVGRMVLKLIVGVNLLFSQLWELQREGRTNALDSPSKEQIQAVCVRFLKSPERIKMNEVIEKGIHIGNCFNLEAVMKVAKNAIKAAHGEAFEVRARSEREKNQHWMSYNHLDK